MSTKRMILWSHIAIIIVEIRQKWHHGNGEMYPIGMNKIYFYSLMNTVKANTVKTNNNADDLEFDFSMCHGSYICDGSYICCRQYIYR